MKLMPASSDASSIFSDSASSLGPPKFIAPRHSDDTRTPVRPSVRSSFIVSVCPTHARIRAVVEFSNLDQPLFDGADASKGDLVTYLDAVADRLIAELRDRPLSVIRVHRGQEAFMQKNLPKY